MISHEQLAKLAICHKVVRLLAQAYSVSGQAAHALTCVQNVRKLQDFPDDAPDLCLTATEALIQLDRPEEADAELLALVLHKDASAALCLASLTAVLEAPGCSALKPAADIVLERFAEDATVPLRLVQALLGASEDEDINQEKGSIVLDIAGNEKENDSTKDQRKSMYMLLWDRATQRFTSKDYKACEDFCTAALGYAEADAEAAVARQLALAHLAQRYPDRSPEDLGIAAEDDPSSLADKVPKLKAVLMQEEARKALHRLRPLMNSDDASLDFMKAMHSELELMSDEAVMKQVLTTLWEEAIRMQGPSKRPGDNVVIFRHLSVLIQEMEKDALQDSSSKPSNVAGGHQGSMASADDEDFAAAAELYRACGCFFEAIPSPTQDDLVVQRNNYTLAARTMMDAHSYGPNREQYLDLAQTLLDKAAAALEATRHFTHDPENLKRARTAHYAVETESALRQGRHSHLLQLIEQAKQIYTVEHLLEVVAYA
ncbi:g2275 [Coccomyxa viridis]|uniref:G2275 protein n=1 Tax=Coccomyxa viridis TaxID=1274662 RepID=A0ABP1FNW9_9CHLO